MSIAKNNNNATQQTEQKATANVDSVKTNINPKNY
jgi:hypothetical protein